MTDREHAPFAPGKDEWGYTGYTMSLSDCLDIIRGYTMAGWQLVTWHEAGEGDYYVLLVEKDEYIEAALQGKYLTHAK